MQIISTSLDAAAIGNVARLLDKNLKLPEIVIDEKVAVPTMKAESDVVGMINIIKHLITMVKKPAGIPKAADNVSKMWDWIGYGVEMASLLRLGNNEVVFPKLLPLKDPLASSQYLADNVVSLCDVFLLPYINLVLKEYGKKQASGTAHGYSFALRYNNLLCTTFGGCSVLATPETEIPPFVAAKDAAAKKGKGKGKAQGKPKPQTE